MTSEEEYVERLEKIIDKQDNLLSQFDARFNQQDSLNEYLFKQNIHLEENIQKHEELTEDLNKTVAQQKNDLEKLKKELEEQVKIQQDLHKEYGDVIKKLTDDLEKEQAKNENLTKKQSQLEAEIKKLDGEKPAKTKKTDTPAGNTYYDTLDKKTANNTKICPKCKTEINETDLFCGSCGEKL